MNWQVYIIECQDATFYTGITTDVLKRYQRHAQMQGAKYFRAHQPLRLVYVEIGHTRSTASKREIAIKKLTRIQKIQLLSSDANVVVEFS